MSGHRGANAVRVIRAALIANLAISAMKFVAAYLSGSTATLAEAVHSLADAGNQALLFTGIRLSLKRDDTRFPFGRAKERYFWPFIVALLLFTLGGAFALYEGFHKLAHPTPPDLSEFWSLRRGPLVSLIVLGASVVIEIYSCAVALREFRELARGRRLEHALFEVKDPTIPLVLMEDIAALVGLMLAFAAVCLSALTGNGIWDAVGSILIGVLLTVVAGLIARDSHSLLLGERAAPDVEEGLQRIAEGTPGVRGVTQLLTMHMGPEFVIVAMKVAFEPESTLAKVEAITDDIERRVRERLPAMKKIFIEPDSRGDMRGVAARPDEARDAPAGA